ncbi:MAG TPA: hypothetical protein VGQ73_04340 [Gemmatimonadales bacterium]|jgi:hypothetical protein|nr:hypothetical protein [Gemmatimonadales bacterium]
MDNQSDANKAQQILERTDANGERIYDHVQRDSAGQWIARRHDDHTQWDRV